jgi:hypothetical protein
MTISTGTTSITHARIDLAAQSLPLSAVRLTGGPLKHAQDLDAAYLLNLEPDRMMAHYRIRAGLEPKASGYGGWDGDGRNLTGHIAGHYLSAVSLMYASTGDNRFKERADYIVAEMDDVQRANGNGYLGALEGGQERFAEVARGDIRSGGFDLNGLWAPWYVLHKTFAGLRDAYRHTGNETALAVEIRFAEWAETVLIDLDGDQTQRMLNTEFGGMGEILADLYADTLDSRWLRLSDRFEHQAVVDPLANGRNNLDGLHGNTQIPKLIGSLTRYLETGSTSDGAAARFFWHTVVDHHSYATGGHGKDEYFGPPDRLSERVNGRTCESCNIYNMLKMTRTLFAVEPDIRKAEYHERALFNHVLGSIDPIDGRVCYMVPIGQGVEHEYQSLFDDFTCCVGSGMESHAMHGHGIYYVSQDRLWVNLYAPSTAEWSDAGVTLAMLTEFPEGDKATLTLSTQSPRHFTLCLRRPSWCGDGFSVAVNGERQLDVPSPGSYVEITRTWNTGDVVNITLPKSIRIEAVPDNPSRVALLWGPLVLAGDLGPDDHAGRVDIPVIVTDGRPDGYLIPDPEHPGGFKLSAVNAETNAETTIDLVPFYRLHRRTYSVYWDMFTREEWKSKQAEISEANARRRALDEATVAFVQPGEMQPERDYHQEGEETYPDRVLGRPARRARKWFSFDIPVAPRYPMALIVTYRTEELQKRGHRILADGQIIGEHLIERSRPGSEGGRFHDVEYAIPSSVVDGKTSLTIRFEAIDASETAAVFGLRMIRA